MVNIRLDRAAAKAVRVLRQNQAPNELIECFKGLYEINRSWGFAATVNDLLLDACKKFNFTAPFSRDGTTRHFRAYVLDHSRPEYAADCAGNLDRDPDPKQEQSYRRGYDQGFSHARQMIGEGKSLSDLETRQKEIHRWRMRPVQIVGSFPGSEEDYANCLPATRVGISPRLRFKIFHRDGFRCQICGRCQSDGVRLHVDHKVSIADGGSESENNLQTLCCECNLGKSSDSMH